MRQLLTICCIALLPALSSLVNANDQHQLERAGTEFRLIGDFAAASRIEARLINEFDTPIGHVFALNSIVTQLTWDETITDHDDALLHHAGRTLSWCEARLAQNRADVEASYYCGMASFALSYFRGLRGSYYQAGRLGTRSISYFESALEADPDFIDAKMYLGVAYYIADNLPPFIRMFSRFLWFIPTGNSEKSLPYIRDVIDGSEHYGFVARYIFSSLVSRQDSALLQESRDHLYQLVSRYPQNPRFQIRYLSLLLEAQDYEATLAAAREIEAIKNI